MANNTKRQNKLRKGENLAVRSSRYVRELKSGKSEITGEPLTNGQRRFRNGVLNERSISAEQHKYNNRSGGKSSNKPKTTNSKKRLNVNWSNYRSNDFDYDEYGNIKGSYVNGKFEPD